MEAILAVTYPPHFTIQIKALSPFACVEDTIEVSIRASAFTRMAEFEDFLPIMAEKLGESDFMAELCNGFRLLADLRLGLITLESLKRNSAFLGLDSLTDSELRAMMEEGDLDGDGALNEHEFCVLMVRLSPSFMDEADKWLNKALVNDLEEILTEK